MFEELTRDLLDLTVDHKGETGSFFAFVIDGCCCSCCGCLFLC